MQLWKSLKFKNCYCFSENRPFSAKAQAKTKETKIVQQMKTRISSSGPVTVAEYMKEVCINPMSVSFVELFIDFQIYISYNFVNNTDISLLQNLIFFNRHYVSISTLL